MRYAVEVESSKANTFEIPGATIVEAGLNEDDGTVVFIVESEMDIGDVSCLPGVIVVEPL